MTATYSIQESSLPWPEWLVHCGQGAHAGQAEPMGTCPGVLMKFGERGIPLPVAGYQMEC